MCVEFRGKLLCELKILLHISISIVMTFIATLLIYKRYLFGWLDFTTNFSYRFCSISWILLSISLNFLHNSTQSACKNAWIFESIETGSVLTNSYMNPSKIEREMWTRSKQNKETTSIVKKTASILSFCGYQRSLRCNLLFIISWFTHRYVNYINLSI